MDDDFKWKEEKCWRGLILTVEIVSKYTHTTAVAENPFIKVLSAKILVSQNHEKEQNYKSFETASAGCHIKRILVIIENGIFPILFNNDDNNDVR